MKKKFKHYSLPYEKVLPYFVDHFSSELSFGKEIEEYIDFSKGSFFTLLPEGVSSDRLIDFDHGEILPSKPMNSEGTYRKVVTMELECSEFIAAFLKKNPQSTLIVEDYNRVGYSPIPVGDVPIYTLEKEIYYVLNKEHSIDEIYQASRRCSIIWHFLAFVTNINDNLFLLEKSNIPEICKNIQLVITCGYDGESFIFWQRG